MQISQRFRAAVAAVAVVAAVAAFGFVVHSADASSHRSAQASSTPAAVGTNPTGLPVTDPTEYEATKQYLMSSDRNKRMKDMVVGPNGAKVFSALLAGKFGAVSYTKFEPNFTGVAMIQAGADYNHTISVWVYVQNGSYDDHIVVGIEMRSSTWDPTTLVKLVPPSDATGNRTWVNPEPYWILTTYQDGHMKTTDLSGGPTYTPQTRAEMEELDNKVAKKLEEDVASWGLA